MRVSLAPLLINQDSYKKLKQTSLMQEAQGASTFFLFCQWETGGQDRPQECMREGNGALDNLLPTGQMQQAGSGLVPNGEDHQARARSPHSVS